MAIYNKDERYIDKVDKGLYLFEQYPLDAKAFFKDFDSMIDLGPDNQLALIYYRGMIVVDLSTGNKYIWKEWQPGGDEIGAIPNGYIYPDGYEKDEYNYSNKRFNFVRLYEDTVNIYQHLLDHINDHNNPHQTSLVNLIDTLINNPQSGQGIVYNGSQWINIDIATQDELNQLISQFNAHINDTSIHFTQDQISVDHTHISDWNSQFTTDFEDRWNLKTTDDLPEGNTNLYDKTVTFTGGNNVTISGTYPDFIINDNSANSTDLQNHINNHYWLKREGITYGILSDNAEGSTTNQFTITSATYAETDFTAPKQFFIDEILIPYKQDIENNLSNVLLKNGTNTLFDGIPTVNIYYYTHPVWNHSVLIGLQFPNKYQFNAGDSFALKITLSQAGEIGTVVDSDLSTQTYHDSTGISNPIPQSLVFAIQSNDSYSINIESDGKVSVNSSSGSISDLVDKINSKQDNLGYTPENTANKGIAGGYAPLDNSAKIPETYLPSLAITSTYVVPDIPSRDGLTVQEGDVAIVQSESKSYIYDGNTWQELLTPPDSVTSVNGQTGTVSLTSDDISEGTNNLYDKVVTFANSANVNISGIYPNFSISDTAASQTDLNNHITDTNNPHNITATQINAIEKKSGISNDYIPKFYNGDITYSRYYESNIYPRTYVSNSISVNGWYTIGAIIGNKAGYGRFMISVDDGGKHDFIVVEAGIQFGKKPYIKIISSTSYSSTFSIQQFRIKYGGTYDGAVLQLYSVQALGNVTVQLDPAPNTLYNSANIWTLKNIIPDATDPGTVSNYSALTNYLYSSVITNISETFQTLPFNVNNAVRINPDNSVSSKPDILLNQNGLIAVDSGYTFYLGGHVFSFRDGTTSTATELGKLNSTGMYAADFIQTSDIRLKEDIDDLPTELNVDGLRPVRYKLKSTGEYKYGFIAQEVEKVIPEIVFENDEGYKQFSNSSIIPILVKEIQILKQEIRRFKDGCSNK